MCCFKVRQTTEYFVFVLLVNHRNQGQAPADCYCRLLLVLTVGGYGRFSVLLRSKANNQSNHAAGQHDFKVVTANCVLRGQKGEQGSNGQTKQKTKR